MLPVNVWQKSPNRQRQHAGNLISRLAIKTAFSAHKNQLQKKKNTYTHTHTHTKKLKKKIKKKKKGKKKKNEGKNKNKTKQNKPLLNFFRAEL
jgi:hypothetical protein